MKIEIQYHPKMIILRKHDANPSVWRFEFKSPYLRFEYIWDVCFNDSIIVRWWFHMAAILNILILSCLKQVNRKCVYGL